ncbi:MAG TPA: OsmC family protein [Oligoflexia bacterium]|nr:OsmC family protein [Oligoflexia bacterium]HMR25337.1 OsmC family protein [Oligoflexia bacterium]
MHKNGSAVWTGGLKNGKGTVSTQSGALNNQPYGFNTRFEGAAGTNPEELIGAAHAGCFSMALAKIIEEAGLSAEKIETSAKVTLEKLEDGFNITKVHLNLNAQVPGADENTVKELAQKAKVGCPVSKLLNAEITLETTVA